MAQNALQRAHESLEWKNPTFQSYQHNIPTGSSVILLLGLTGAGKTSYINRITQSALQISDRMFSGTLKVQFVNTTIQGKLVSFVDTPGFDDPERSVAEILLSITAWIRDNLGDKHKVTAALYLHSIETSRVFESAQSNVKLFEQIVGRNAMANVGLVSTHWDAVTIPIAEQREKWLLENSWSNMTLHGAQSYRLNQEEEKDKTMATSLLRL
ncbi:hypothetical protein N431DRAFT_235870 [Stipitochalara longipes BDJ]|nr:hypothetical protein N431DRAFT_235870 [Stipitochalara longipes BDJ]